MRNSRLLLAYLRQDGFESWTFATRCFESWKFATRCSWILNIHDKMVLSIKYSHRVVTNIDTLRYSGPILGPVGPIIKIRYIYIYICVRMLLLGAVLGPRKICRPQAVSRKTQILSATFLISRPRETPQDCKETLMFSMPFKPLCLKNSPFFFWKFCCELPLISCNSRARAAIGHGRKTESNAGGFRTHFGTWF